MPQIILAILAVVIRFLAEKWIRSMQKKNYDINTKLRGGGGKVAIPCSV